jgi:hypothetical protein
MHASSPAERALVHTREVTCRGYRRPDGLWEIEVSMTDRKAYTVFNDHRTVPAGGAFHDMSLRVTVDDDLLIHAIEAHIEAAPHRICPAVTSHFQCLVGLSIGPGFGATVRHQVGGALGCTHMVELFSPLATTAVQTVRPLREAAPGRAATSPPPQIGTCHALVASGDVVAKYWPRFHRPHPPTGTAN